MKKLLSAIAGASVLLSAGVASAQGLPPGFSPPVYGSTWAAKRLAAENQAAVANRSNQAPADQATTPKVADRGTTLRSPTRLARPDS